MRKWIPYFIGLLIPVIIFISFIVMIKKRIFIFHDQFIEKGNQITLAIKQSFENLIWKDVMRKFPVIQAKLNENPQQEEMQIFLKNQIVDSTIVDNIFITDEQLDMRYFYVPLPREEWKKFQWAVQNQPESPETKFFYLKGNYVAYQNYEKLKIFIFLNPDFFYQEIKDKYKFFEKGIVSSQKNFFINFSQDMYQNHEKLISDTLGLIRKNKGFELKLEGNQIFQAPVMLKNDNRVLWEMNLFVGINPWNMPLNLWHKMILILTAAFVLIIFVMLMIKIKHESDLEQMREYEEEGQTDFLHEQFATFSESEMEEVEEDYALGAPLEGEDEEYVKEVPESYYEKESERKKDRELSSIIGEVRGHEEKFQKYSSLWKNINQVIENKSYRMALNLYDPKNEDFIPHFQKNIPESAPLTVEKDNWIMQQYVLMGKALMVTSSALSAPPLKEIFNSEEYFDVNSCFIAPLRKDGEVRGIFLLFAPEVLEEDTVREINSLINMG